jgi:hypothetical protein
MGPCSQLLGLLDRPRPKASPKSVVQKHSILRTIFLPFQDTMLQVILCSIEIQISEVFLTTPISLQW